MKSYMKPTISLAITGYNGGYGSCIVKADLDLLQSILGNDFTFSKNSFAMSEGCVEGIPVDIYCKFTSAELGAAHAFIS